VVVLGSIAASFGNVTSTGSVHLTLPPDADGESLLEVIGADANGNVYVSPEMRLVTITSAQLNELHFAFPTTSLQISQLRQISVYGNFSDGTTRRVSNAADGTSYESSNPAVASVSPDGTLFGLRAGRTTIIARNGAFKDLLTVTVTEPSGKRRAAAR
jgi:hypothetical protein